MTVHVTIIDPSDVIRAAIVSLLASEQGVEIAVRAGSLFEQPLDDHETDVWIVDFRTCATAGTALKALLASHARVRLIVTTPGAEHEYRNAISDLAPDGWVEKTQLAAELLTTLRRLADQH